jgi:hypothetical protein
LQSAIARFPKAIISNRILGGAKMVWSKKPSNNELGEYLPDADAEQYIQTEPLEAEDEVSAEEMCDEIAAEYGGVDPKVKQTGEKQYDCKFTMWS